MKSLSFTVDKLGGYEDKHICDMSSMCMCRHEHQISDITGRQQIDLVLKQAAERFGSCRKFNKAAEPQNTQTPIIFE